MPLLALRSRSLVPLIGGGGFLISGPLGCPRLDVYCLNRSSAPRTHSSSESSFPSQ